MVMEIKETNVERRSVTESPGYEQGLSNDFIMYVATRADDIVPWGGQGGQFQIRDRQLRNFYMNEPALAAALYSIVIRDAAFSWTIKGDAPKTAKKTQEMLHQSNLGKGWLDFAQKWRTDFLTQDNGAFFEIIRQTDSPDSPVIGINHLDAGRCRRTGVPDWPVIYTDRKNVEHKMRPHQISMRSDWPSPIETANGVGFCAVSRVLRYAQIMRDTSIRDRERTSGSDPKTLHIIRGVAKQTIEDTFHTHKEEQIDKAYARYSKPVIFSTIDPNQEVQHVEVDLAPKPDVDYQTLWTWWLTLLAMALGVDYQDLAPLSSGNLGTSTQSLVLHQKSKGKGPELFMKTIEHEFNFHGVIPKNVQFEYNEKDMAEQKENADILKTEMEALKMAVDSGILTPQTARNIMLDSGLLSQELYDIEAAGQPDATEEVVATDDDKLSQQPGGQSATVEGEKQNLAPLGEDPREKWERNMARDMGKSLDEIFSNLKKSITGIKALVAEKATPEEAFDAERFWEDFRITMGATMRPYARDIYNGAAEVNIGLGFAVNMEAINLNALDFAREYTTEWVNALETTTREGMRKALVTWQESGLGKRGLPDLVKSIEPLFGKDRAKRIAQTETTRIFDLGNQAAHINAGIEYEIWQTANDDRVRPEHEALEGQVFRVDEGPRPSDFVNCRCARSPIPADEALAILGQ